MRPDHKALIFIGAIAVLGAAVRVVRAAGIARSSSQPALERQVQAADSAARAARARQSAPRRRQGGAKNSSRRPARDSARGVSPKSRNSGPLDRPGYIAGRLDLDVATFAQIDSLPGVTRLMARRIVIDRMLRGPFVTRDGLRRVDGAGPRFVARIDSLITFSGTVLQPDPADTASPRPRRVRRSPSPRPAVRRTMAPPRRRWLRAAPGSSWRGRGRLAFRPRAASAFVRESRAG